MKTGRSIQELAAEITRQHASKRDFLADTRMVKMTSDEKTVGLRIGDNATVGIKPIAHDQIAEHVGIPKPYYQKMLKEEPGLLATNVQKWFDKYPATRLFRTLDGENRAMMSNSYRPLDNYDLAQAVLPVIADRKLEIMSCEITERRLYLKAVDTQLFRDVPVGRKWGDGSHTIFDTCAPSIIISNSEVGYGRLVVETGVYTKACTNLAMWADGGMKKTHVGVRNNILNDVAEIDHLLTDETKRKTDAAVWAQVRDVIAGAFNPELFDVRLAKLEAASKNEVTIAQVTQLLDNAATRFGFNETEKGSILDHLSNGGQLSQYGLHAAITRSAQDNDSYDRATELEYIGGKVIELTRADWNELAEAA
jgi:hypothetical protein